MTLHQSRSNFTLGKQLVGTAALALGCVAILAPHSAYAATHTTHTHMVARISHVDSGCTPTYPPCNTPAPGSNTGSYAPGSNTGSYAPGSNTGSYTPSDDSGQTPVVVQQPPTSPIDITLTPVSIDVPQQTAPPILIQPAPSTFNVTPPQITVNLPPPPQQTIYFAPNPTPIVQYNAAPPINYVTSTQPSLPPVIITVTPVTVPITPPVDTSAPPATSQSQGPCQGVGSNVTNVPTPCQAAGSNVTNVPTPWQATGPVDSGNAAPCQTAPVYSNNAAPCQAAPVYSNNAAPCPTTTDYSSNVTPAYTTWTSYNDNSAPCPTGW
jgi:hypothetical protein